MANDPRRDAEIALAQLKVRKEMRSADLDEDSNVIEREALSRRPKSDPAPVRWTVAVLNTLPQGWGRVIVVLALIGAVTAIVITTGKVAGWF